MKNAILGFITAVLVVGWVLLVASGVISIKMGIGVPICFLLGCAFGAVLGMIWITGE